MNTWAWTIFGFSVQMGVGIFFEDRLGKGKILTRPMQIACIRFSLRRFSIRNLYRLLPLLVLPAAFRVLQLSVLWISYLPVALFTNGGKLFTGLYWMAVTALYLDDYLTGDDDKWKKFKEGVKNKVKWLMDLPKQAPIPETQ